MASNIEIRLSIQTGSAYIFFKNEVTHSWENYIYSFPMLYTDIRPFVIRMFSTVLPFKASPFLRDFTAVSSIILFGRRGWMYESDTQGYTPSNYNLRNDP